MFWLAYILTRPLGASIGDWMSQKSKHEPHPNTTSRTRISRFPETGEHPITDSA